MCFQLLSTLRFLLVTPSFGKPDLLHLKLVYILSPFPFFITTHTAPPQPTAPLTYPHVSAFNLRRTWPPQATT